MFIPYSGGYFLALAFLGGAGCDGLIHVCIYAYLHYICAAASLWGGVLSDLTLDILAGEMHIRVT